jgi:hypothetical protein
LFWRAPCVARQYCDFVLAGDSCMCQQSIFHVSAQIVCGLVDLFAIDGGILITHLLICGIQKSNLFID